jgi:excisionase family DNA binding protein
MGQALTVKQVAELLAVNERTVYRMANSGELPGFKVSGSWRFMADDIRDWIEEQKKRAKDEPDNEETA